MPTLPSQTPGHGVTDGQVQKQLGGSASAVCLGTSEDPVSFPDMSGGYSAQSSQLHGWRCMAGHGENTQHFCVPVLDPPT